MEMNDISNLASLLRENGDKVLSGQSKLSLTIALLKKINEAFSLIIENDEECSSSFHVINTNNSKVEILHDIQFLHDFVQKTVGLKVSNSNVLINKDSDTTALEIHKFRNLKYLELRKVPINLLSGIQSVRAQLQSIVCIHCIQRLEDLLLKCGADHSSGFVWSDLQEAVFSYNGIDSLDHSLKFAPWLQILDLSHNRISCAEGIEYLPNLKYLNMSYNLLESIPSFNKDACGKLQVLVMKNNYIEDLSGVLMLECLMELDLSCNCLSSHDSLHPFLQLPTLIWLNLDGNPLSFHPQHRIYTAHHLHDNSSSGKFMLDLCPLSRSERLAVGSLGGAIAVQKTFKEESSSFDSSSVSERKAIRPKERGGHSKSNQGFKKSGHVREAVISEQDDDDEESVLSSSILTNSLELSTDHLETKKQIETLRERYGEDNWLHSHGGLCVQDVLGLQKSEISPSYIHSPVNIAQERADSQNRNVSSVFSQVNKEDENKITATDSCEIEEDNSTKEENIVSAKLPSEVQINGENMEKPASAEDKETFYVDDEEQEEDDEVDDEDEEQLYLVQRQWPDLQGTDEYFLVVTERWLKERETLCGKTREKWTIASLLSCVKVGGDPPSSVVQLTFDTVRRDRQERLYVMDEKDAQKLVRTLRSMLDARPLTDMNQHVYRCMKCSTQFSREVPPLGGEQKALTCPTCSSTLVIEMDEVPLPSHQRDKEKLVSDKEKIPSSVFNTSPSQSSIGRSGVRAVSDSGPSTVTGGRDKLQVTAVIHHSEVEHQSSRSAASLDPFADSPNNTETSVRHWDSDIEIISNPSQSSIEVLDEQGRLQGSSTPSRKRSSEERHVASVVIPSQHSVVSDSNVLALTGLTESSSSGSLTDSICTTYEIQSTSVLPREGAVVIKADERENKIAVDNSTDLKVKRVNISAEKLPNDSLKKPEEESPTEPFSLHYDKLSPRTNYASLLEGLLQNVGSKIFSKSPDKILDSPSCRETTDCSNAVKYSYTDFSVVDHRVKLHLYLHVFQQKQEELLFLLRAHVVTQSSSSSYPGCLVVSTKKVYILQITGEEGDDPDQWLHKVESSAIEMLMLLFPLLWHQGIGIELLKEGGDGSSCYLFILQDQIQTVNFFSFLTGVSLPEKCIMDKEMTERQTLALQQLLLSAAASEDADPNICLSAVAFSTTIQRNEELKELDLSFIIITSTDLILVTGNLQWLFPMSSVIPQANCAQKMSNLLEIELEDHCKLTLNFLDEVAGSDESWTLKFGTKSTMNAVVSAIKVPWEELFSVPLHVVSKNKSLTSS